MINYRFNLAWIITHLSKKCVRQTQQVSTCKTIIIASVPIDCLSNNIEPIFF